MNYGNSDMAVKAAAYAGGSNAASQGYGTGASLGDMQRQPELPLQIERLDKALCYAEESLNRLRDRLDNGAMRPEAPTPQGIGDKQLSTAPPASGYASTVYVLSERAHGLADRMQAMLRRLEV